LHDIITKIHLEFTPNHASQNIHSTGIPVGVLYHRPERRWFTTHWLKAFQSNTGDDAGYNRKCKAAIERIRKLQLLNQIKEGEPRFEISPTLKLIFPAEEIVRLEKRYQELATQGAIDSVDVDSESNDEEAV
jgi:hypothetical protein